jgi:hypothetical protein
MHDSRTLLTRRNFLRFIAGLGIAVGFNQLRPIAARQLSSNPQSTNPPTDPEAIDLVIQETPVTIPPAFGKLVCGSDGNYFRRMRTWRL